MERPTTEVLPTCTVGCERTKAQSERILKDDTNIVALGVMRRQVLHGLYTDVWRRRALPWRVRAMRNNYQPEGRETGYEKGVG